MTFSLRERFLKIGIRLLKGYTITLTIVATKRRTELARFFASKDVRQLLEPFELRVGRKSPEDLIWWANV